VRAAALQREGEGFMSTALRGNFLVKRVVIDERFFHEAASADRMSPSSAQI
jgi:hypothetical protein